MTTPLRQRMIDDLRLAGYSERTQQAYVASVRKLAEHYRRSPDQIDEEALRRYFLYLKDERSLKRGSITIALCGIKFFYQKTLQRQWSVFDIARPAREARLPVVLSREEVQTILAGIRIAVYRLCLFTINARSTTSFFASPPSPSRSSPWIPGTSAHGRAWWASCTPGPGISATTPTFTSS